MRDPICNMDVEDDRFTLEFEGRKYSLENVMTIVLACLIPIAAAVVILYSAIGGPYLSLLAIIAVISCLLVALFTYLSMRKTKT